MSLGVTLLALTLAQPVPLIPRELFFGNPDLVGARLSPDGKQVGWSSPDANGVLQLFVQPMPVGQSIQITSGGDKAITRWAWAESPGTLLYLRDAEDGVHLFVTDVATRSARDLTPWPGVRAELLGTAQKTPDQVLVLVNQRDKSVFDVHRVNLKTGATELDTKNPGDAVAYAFDGDGVVRALLARLGDGGAEVRVRDTVKLPWRTLLKTTFHENVALLGFAFDGKGVYLATSVGTDTTRVVEKNLKSGTERQLAASATSDLREWIYNPWKMAVQGAAFEKAGKLEWTPIESTVFRDLELLAAFASPGVFRVTSRDRADALWLVEVDSDLGPRKTVLWDRNAKKGAALFSQQPRLDGQTLAETTPVIITARDGLVLPSLLTLPPWPVSGPRPMVLAVHGGPWSQDTWGFDARAQFFANRGYAVLQVNFRGSTGYGKRFLNAGNREWGRRMQDDLTDAVAWAVKEGVADPKRVAIFGRSYGGYAALAGLALNPSLYRCGIDGSGPIDLVSLAQSAAPAVKPLLGEWEQRLGDVDDRADKARLEQSSAMTWIDRVQSPLLIAHGGADVQVKLSQVQQLVARLEKNGDAVTFVQYSDEGHHLSRPQNAEDFFGRTEAFLAGCIGGRAQPMPREGKVAGSTAIVTSAAARAAAR